MTDESQTLLDKLTSKPATSAGGKPRLVRRADVKPLLWGDEEAGYANDLFYQLTPQLAIVVACVPPGGSFTSSKQHRTVFNSDEALYVLDGQYTIQNPESGEVCVAGCRAAHHAAWTSVALRL